MAPTTCNNVHPSTYLSSFSNVTINHIDATQPRSILGKYYVRNMEEQTIEQTITQMSKYSVLLSFQAFCRDVVFILFLRFTTNGRTSHWDMNDTQNDKYDWTDFLPTNSHYLFEHFEEILDALERLVVFFSTVDFGVPPMDHHFHLCEVFLEQFEGNMVSSCWR